MNEADRAVTLAPERREARDEDRRALMHPGDTPFLSFRIAKCLIRHSVPGGWRLMSVAARRGALNRMVRYPLGNGISICVPLWRQQNCWSRPDLLTYERALIGRVAARAARLSRPAALIDCGADIGVFSLKLAALGVPLARVIALEPNVSIQGILKQNLAGLPCPFQMMDAAIGSAPGWADLYKAPGTLDEAAYMIPTATGKTPVVTIDTLPLPPDTPVIAKLDVEGWEGEAIKGALATLAAREFVLAIEANGFVTRRTGVDSTTVLNLIPRVRECEVTVAEIPERPVDLDRPFAEQFPEMMSRCLNVVVAPAAALR